MASARLQYLFERFKEGTCTDPERLELYGLSLESTNKEQLRQLMEGDWSENPAQDLSEEQANEILHRIFEIETGRKKVVRMSFWKRVAVAASIMILLGTGMFLLLNKPRSVRRESSNVNRNIPAPDRTRASITLADGRTIYIDSLDNGQILSQNNIIATKSSDGKIVYSREDGKAVSQREVYNTLSNPRGSKVIDLILSDGSHVWLNSGSSITYPVAFIGNERKVTMTGEAYFEIKHNDKQPFYVSGNGWGVRDLGTAFNINAYSDEPNIRVTLTEGKAQVENKSPIGNLQSAVLKPGQQSSIQYPASSISVISDVDIEQVLAWKDNRFIFSGDNIQSVMRQLARWYDVDIVYEGQVSMDEFVGVISRSRYENISAILDVLEKTRVVKFRIEGRKVIVSKG